MKDKCKYYEWDEPDFIIPEQFILDDKSELADAIDVFWSVGGMDFLNVVDSQYYASNWLDYVGELYSKIDSGVFEAYGKLYQVPMSEEQKKELAGRGVPNVFITDLK